MLRSVTECYRVLQSVTEFYKVLQSVTEYYRVLQSITECYRVLQSITECYRVLQSITEYNRVLQSISSASTWTNFWACFSHNNKNIGDFHTNLTACFSLSHISIHGPRHISNNFVILLALLSIKNQSKRRWKENALACKKTMKIAIFLGRL